MPRTAREIDPAARTGGAEGVDWAAPPKVAAGGAEGVDWAAPKVAGGADGVD